MQRLALLPEHIFKVRRKGPADCCAGALIVLLISLLVGGCGEQVEREPQGSSADEAVPEDADDDGATPSDDEVAEEPDAAQLDASVELSALVPSAGAYLQQFHPEDQQYTWLIPVGSNEVTLTPTGKSPSASIRIQGKSVVSGEASDILQLPVEGATSQVSVEVTSADGTQSGLYQLTLKLLPLALAPKVIAIGDSTLANYDPITYPNQRGWGQEFPRFISGDLLFSNKGINGRSTKSYVEGGSWALVKASLNVGDTVFIQFAHNDEKDGGIEGDSERGTDAWGAYHDYLSTFVKETRALGASPVLLTPVVRLGWSGAALNATSKHDLTGNGIAVGDANYVEAMRDVAETLGCPLVDLTKATQTLVEAYGPEQAKARLYIEEDNTHLSRFGAASFAQLVAQGLVAEGLFVEELDPQGAFFSESTEVNLGRILDFGSIHSGTGATRELSVFALGLPENNGLITVTAPSGFGIATELWGNYAGSLQLTPFLQGLAPTSIFIRFLPVTEGSTTGQLSFAAGEVTWELSLTGAGLPVVVGSAEMSVSYPLVTSLPGGACEVMGEATCLPQVLVGLESSEPQWVTALEPAPAALESQVLSPEGTGAWVSETEVNPSRYVEFSVSPEAGKTLNIDSIDLSTASLAGGSLAYQVSYSLEADYASPVQVFDLASNRTNELVENHANVSIDVPEGQVLRVRVYPYSKAQVTEKFLGLRDLRIHGISY